MLKSIYDKFARKWKFVVLFTQVQKNAESNYGKCEIPPSMNWQETIKSSARIDCLTSILDLTSTFGRKNI